MWVIKFHPEPPDNPGAAAVGAVLALLIVIGAVYVGFTAKPTCPEVQHVR